MNSERVATVDVREYAPGVLLIREADYQRLLAVVESARGFLSDDIYTALVDNPMDWANESADIDRVTTLRDALAAWGEGE